MEKRTTIYDIAKALGISTATVNRALTGKPRVKEETRKLVIETAAKMGFKPNTLARSLARRPLHLAVIGFTSFSEFHAPFLKGARDASEELADYNIKVDFFRYDDGATDSPKSDRFLEDTLHRIADEDYDGVLALARHTDTFQMLRDRGIYVATAVNDIDPAMRNFHICYNGFVAGRIAAELIYRAIPDRTRPVAVSSGFRNVTIHDRTLSGFREQIRHTPLNLYSVMYNMDNEELAYESTVRLLDECPELGAIYINSFNYRGVIRAIYEKKLEGRILLIASDISEELKQLVEEGVVFASIFQNQYEQGRRGLRLMWQALDTAEPVEETV